jgi:GNAT superfamily N-acetyltransferase
MPFVQRITYRTVEPNLPMNIDYRVSPPITNDALNSLFIASWPDSTEGEFQRMLAHSLLYVCAYMEDRLIGFVNVAWDGGVHGFILDTTVHPEFRRAGIGVALVKTAASAAKDKGIHWLHVDYEPDLTGFYAACGFRDTEAGLMRLNGSS